MVAKLNYEAANAFSAADKKVRLFISKEHFLSIPPHHRLVILLEDVDF